MDYIYDDEGVADFASKPVLTVYEEDGLVVFEVEHKQMGVAEVRLSDDQVNQLEAALRRRRHALPFKNINQGEN